MARTSPDRGETGRDGWLLLPSVLLILLGVLHVGIGVVALLRPEVLAETRGGLLLPIGLTALAWSHVVLGVVAAGVGMGLARGRRWARPAAIQVGCLAAVVNFAFVGLRPVWSVTALVLTALVIYGVAVHGAEA